MRNKILAGLLSTSMLFGTIYPANAYYSKTDYAEWVQIQPNQSAFLIPMTGANASTQAQFGSQEYYSANKVATKRVQIPHGKLLGTGSMFDYYIPTAQLILIDRAPYNSTWTNDTTTGTSSKKEGMSFESKDGIDIEVDITIATHVNEEDASKFLYNFGVKPAASLPYDATAQYQTDAYYSATYASILYGRSLTEIMDTVVRGEVHAELARQFAQYNFGESVGNKDKIIEVVKNDVSKWLMDRGITLDYIGFASPLNFDKKVQDAIDNVFVAHENALATKELEVALPVMEAQAKIGLIQGISIGAQKWQIPNMPSFMMLPSNFIDQMTSFLSSQVTSITGNSTQDYGKATLNKGK